MATERLNLIVNERGARVVTRNIDQIGTASQNASAGVDLLRSALVAIAGGGVLAVLGRLTNQFTQLQNRLRTVTSTTVELNTVTDELFNISQRTRSSLQSNAELFARLGQATRELGVSQQQLLDFTESLNQAITLSGASATEAQAGIIQLSQGLASGALRGDELRSVLEQLPAVADVVAQSLGVTRGELRQLGSEGRITADIVLTAFQQAREELADRFAQTVLTVPQSFQVLENAAVRAFGELDSGLGITRNLAEAVVFLADNIDILVRALTGLAIIVGLITSFNALRIAITAIVAVIALNPFGVLVTALAAATGVVIGFADQISVTGDGVATLADVFASTGDFIVRGLTELQDFFADVFNPLIVAANVGLQVLQERFGIGISSISEIFTVLLNVVGGVFDRIVGLGFGVIGALRVVFNRVDVIIANPFQSAVTLITTALNGLVSLFESAVNAIIRQANRVAGAFSDIEIPEIDIPQIQLPANFNQDVLNLGDDVSNAITQGLESRPITRGFEQLGEVVGGTIDSILIDAELRAQERIANIQPEERADLTEVLGEPSRNVGQFREIVETLAEESQLLQLNNRERQIQEDLLRAIDQIERGGQTVNEAERAALEILLRNNQVLEDRARILDEVNGRQEEFAANLSAISGLLQDEIINQSQAFQAIDNLTGGLLENTVEGNAALVQNFQDTFEQIRQLREADLISEQTAAQLRQRVAIDELETRLENTRSFFSSLSTLSRSENSRLAAIGRAAAITQATIDGVLAVQRALASAPPPVNFALAAAVGVAAAANVAEIAAARQLGGDLNQNQLSRVGEGARPEIFRSSVTGQQFLIPPERGRVEPADRLAQTTAQQTTGTGTTAQEPPVMRVTIVNNLTPEALRNLIEDPESGRVIINFIGDNSGSIREQIGL